MVSVTIKEILCCLAELLPSLSDPQEKNRNIDLFRLLALERLTGVVPEVNFRKIYIRYLCLPTLALKPTGYLIGSPK